MTGPGPHTVTAAWLLASLLTFNQIQNLQAASLPAVFSIRSVGAWCHETSSVEDAPAMAPWPLTWAAATLASLEGVRQTGPLPAVSDGGVVRVGGLGLAGAQQQTREVSSGGLLLIGEVGGLPVGAEDVFMTKS